MANYLDDTQRRTLAHLATTLTWRTEWPTWVVIATIYASWFGVAVHVRALGVPVAAVLLAFLSAWYMSLQHGPLPAKPVVA
ncbi:hypothetical protein [Paraburkholderia gardini]|uniref:hypothetical protein n=1 Tax=Paraburkholderia gardini TaxID=2823469 RepID=UPI001DCF20FC|nr:hypothetical protein R69919_00784 [Paraburkholderia gardini]